MTTRTLGWSTRVPTYTDELDTIDDHVGGDTAVLPFVVEDLDADTADARKDLTNGTITWALVDWDEQVVLSTADDGVTAVITAPTSGEFEIQIDAGVGEQLHGTHEEWIRVELAGGDRRTWISEMTIEEGVINEVDTTASTTVTRLQSAADADPDSEFSE